MQKKNCFVRLCAFSFLLVLSCSTIIKPKINKEIRGIKITENFPLIDSKGKLTSYDTFSTKIYYYEDKVLYHSSYHFDSTVDDKQLISEIRYYFFVYKKGDPLGLLFDPYNNIYGKKILVDSALKKEWCNGLDFYHGYADNLLTLISSSEMQDSGIINKTFSFKGIKDTGVSGISSYWFTNKLNDIEYSLSKELDSIYKMKVYKIRLKNNSRYFKDYNYTLDAIEQAFDLERIDIKNESEILSYFSFLK